MSIRWSVVAVIAWSFASSQVIAQQQPRPVETRVWALKPTQTPAYKAPLKPWVKLSELKARHKGQSDWREVIVDDGRLSGEYFAAAAGSKVSRRMHPDTREWFAVVEGEVRVEIEGQEPIHRNAWIAREHSAPDVLLT